MQLDNTDKKILSILMKDGKKTYAEIASAVFVSAGTVHGRIKKMEDMGVIKGYNVVVDYDLLGYDISAFLGIYLNKSSQYTEVSQLLMLIPEIVSAHYTTGNYSIFAKIICKDTRHLRTVLHDKIQKIQGIQRTETFISLEASIDRPIDIGVEE
jgi:Lrp/AsnC family transcriptional regulator, regulator for asnA, asnC and gidA